MTPAWSCENAPWAKAIGPLEHDDAAQAFFLEAGHTHENTHHQNLTQATTMPVTTNTAGAVSQISDAIWQAALVLNLRYRRRSVTDLSMGENPRGIIGG
jgi:hypothetical protein